MIPLEIRDLIDAAVNGVISDKYQHDSQGLESRCAIYAIVGAGCLSQLTGDTFTPVCGSQSIDLTDGGVFLIAPSAAEIGTADSLHEIRNYHCWIESRKGDCVEVVDFTLRHNSAACRVLGINPVHSARESYAWVTMPVSKKGIAHAHETCYYASCLQEDKELTQLLHDFQAENTRAFRYLTLQCLDLIYPKLLELEVLLKKQSRASPATSAPAAL